VQFCLIVEAESRAARYHRTVTETGRDISLDQQLEDIRTQLNWVRDYL